MPASQDTEPRAAPARPPASEAGGGSGPAGLFRRHVTFGRLEAISLLHSVIYLGLLVCAFALDGPQPYTFALGLGHGLIWIGMSITCVTAAAIGLINTRLAVAVALLGCVAPFFGSIEFLRQGRGRRRRAAA